MWFCSQQEIVIRQIGEVWNDTIGEKPSYGRKWRAGDQCAAASMRVNIHFSDADSGTAGIADEMSVQKAGSPDHRDHGEGSTTDTAEPAGDTVPEGGLSNLASIFPAVVAVPAEVVDRLDELLADTTGEPATDSKRPNLSLQREKLNRLSGMNSPHLPSPKQGFLALIQMTK